MPTSAEKRLFCRHLFTEGGSTSTQRHKYLDTLYADVREVLTSGKTLAATSSGGASASFMVLQSFSPQDVAELIDEAHTWADAANLTAALALIGPPARHYGHDFSGLACRF